EQGHRRVCAVDAQRGVEGQPLEDPFVDRRLLRAARPERGQLVVAGVRPRRVADAADRLCASNAEAVPLQVLPAPRLVLLGTQWPPRAAATTAGATAAVGTGGASTTSGATGASLSASARSTSASISSCTASSSSTLHENGSSVRQRKRRASTALLRSASMPIRR